MDERGFNHVDACLYTEIIHKAVPPLCEEQTSFYLGCAVHWFQGKTKRVKIYCVVKKSLFQAVLAAGVLKQLSKSKPGKCWFRALLAAGPAAREL
eukprot:556317-Pelagomonas_calceolata.AAC.1